MIYGEIRMKAITADKITFTALDYSENVIADDCSIGEIFEIADFGVSSSYYPIDVPEVLCAEMQSIVKMTHALIDKRKNYQPDGDDWAFERQAYRDMDRIIQTYKMASAICIKAAFGLWPHQLEL